MNIPQDAMPGEMLALPAMCCEACGHIVALKKHETDEIGFVGTLVGECPCGREWYVQPQRVPAYYLTAKQRGLRPSEEAPEPPKAEPPKESAKTPAKKKATAA